MEFSNMLPSHPMTIPFVVNQDPDKNSSQSPPQINHHCCYGCGDLLEDIFCHQCTCELCGNGAHYGYNCPPKAPIVPNPEPFNNQTINELPQTVPRFDLTYDFEDGNSFTYDSKSNLVHESPNVFDPPSQPPCYSYEFCGNDARYGHYCTPQVPHEAYQCQPMNEDYYHEQNSCYDPNSFGFDQFQPPQYTVNHPIFNAQNDHFNSQNRLMEQLTSMCDMVGQYIQKKEEEKQIEEEQAAKAQYCKIPVCYDDEDNEDYTIAITHNDDQLFYDEDIPKEIYSNLIFDEEIISMKIDPHHFNAESDLIKSLLNRDSSIISSSSKIDSLLDEFAGELTLLKSIPPGINKTDCVPEEENQFISENSDAAFESFSPFFIIVEDIDSLMEEIDLSFTPDAPMPPGIEEDNYDSERDILILEELLSNDSLSLPENESFHFDIPSSSRPPAKPPDGNTGILNVKVMGDIFEHKVPMPRLMFTQSTLVPNQEKSPKLLPYLGHKAFHYTIEYPMMIYGRNTPILDVLLFHFYPP
nr:hypothetical protein [Tanacetum cinerariifolium]